MKEELEAMLVQTMDADDSTDAVKDPTADSKEKKDKGVDESSEGDGTEGADDVTNETSKTDDGEDAGKRPQSTLSTALEQHDRKYHPNGYKPDDEHCVFRETMFLVDEVSGENTDGIVDKQTTKEEGRDKSGLPTEKEFNSVMEQLQGMARIFPKVVVDVLENYTDNALALAEAQEDVELRAALLKDGKVKEALTNIADKLADERKQFTSDFIKTYSAVKKALNAVAAHPEKEQQDK